MGRLCGKPRGDQFDLGPMGPKNSDPFSCPRGGHPWVRNGPLSVSSPSCFSSFENLCKNQRLGGRRKLVKFEIRNHGENTHQSSLNMIPSVQPCWFVEIYFQMICHLVAGMTLDISSLSFFKKGVSAKSTRSPTRETFEHQFFEVDFPKVVAVTGSSQRSEDPRGYRSMCDHPVYQYPCGSLN